jgi:hypothetical protein
MQHIMRSMFNLIIPNLFWYIITHYLSFDLKKLNLMKEVIIFNIININIRNVHIVAISNYIIKGLVQRYNLKWVLRPIIRDLTEKIKEKKILGYKILCTGRFTRKQIASHLWQNEGAVSVNSYANIIKYFPAKVRLKYGICGVKIWLNYGNNNEIDLQNYEILYILPLYIPFKYSFIKNSSLISLSINYWFFIFLKLFFKKSFTFQDYKKFIYFKFKILIHNFLQLIWFKNNKKARINNFDVFKKMNNKLLFIKMNIN